MIYIRNNEIFPVYFALQQAEKYGLPVAWKIDDTSLGIVLKSNITLFTELIRNSFIQDTLFINNYLSIIRIESELKKNWHKIERNCLKLSIFVFLFPFIFPIE